MDRQSLHSSLCDANKQGHVGINTPVALDSYKLSGTLDRVIIDLQTLLQSLYDLSYSVVPSS